ncbi:MAG: CRISPR-associated helicase/endonuclease Cas3 [Clostridiales bacterium GWE2_32_10]|nr:MAG: CRISPR-associated helicase/endonuclease Cas3 [Clostridiales bacterium GWE2_32_10]HBY20025.1 CRISPR-associated helicase/endonuclease Cas3 [Clostridiales bacterium]
MNNYLAKSNPKETIQEHTQKLLFNLEILKNTYPNLEIDWDMLKWACIYHDLGKMNMKFQKRIEQGIRGKNEIPHGILSLPFINYEYLEDEGYTEVEIKNLFQSVAYHHDREFNFTEEYLEKEIKLLKKEFENFKWDILDEVRILKDNIEEQYFVVNERTYSDQKEFFDYIKIKGLLNRLDYAASAHINVEIKNDFLVSSLQKLNYNLNDLQNFMIENRDNNVIAVAQTGMGKTEAGLLWIGDNKGFFTLPLKSAINQIYNRVAYKIAMEENREKVGLLHSDTYSEYMKNAAESDDIDNYFTKTKQLSLPLTICTLDQLFDVVFRYRDFEPKLATMSYSKIVIDEVQMYSDDLLAYLILGLSYITQIGGKFAILTATLPRIVIDLLSKEGIDFILPDKPFINNEEVRHKLKVINTEIDTDIIVENFNYNKILVICNTVKKAQEVYSELCKNETLVEKSKNINLLHGKFIKIHRKEKEDAIFEFGQLDNKENGIWVATQVVEASLDIDFDLLFTELSDINGLFQRMGRCNRKGKRKIGEYNCYVFNGGENYCSGIGKVIDKQIFEFSKEALRSIDGKMTEQDKLEIIDNIYTTEMLKDTEYYKKVIGNIGYIKSMTEYELSKKEVLKRFRNINNVSIIPEQIYMENKDIIEENLDVLDNSINKEDKFLARESILNFTVDLNYYEVEKMIESASIQISKYQVIKIIECEYSKEKGVLISRIKKDEGEEVKLNTII